MGLETGTYIDSLNASNPTASDNVAQGDDHLRLLKSTIKASFPNVTGAVTATHTAINTASTNYVPSGALTAYAGSSAPTGWLLADGSAVSRTTYATLFAAIGTTYGAGNGSSTFNLPNIGGRTIAGKESSASNLTSTYGPDGSTLGATGGAQSVTLTGAQSGEKGHSHTLTMNQHNHSFTGDSHSHTLSYGLDNFHDISGSTPSGNFASGQSKSTSSVQVSGSIGNTTSTGSVSSVSAANASSAHSSVQPTIILNYIIKT
tara:strand:+ start:1653 stop:2432 length:780 start_codon:yes stop_codon:yes gene_type:complete